MALALTTQAVHHALRSKRLFLIATPSGNYTTGGDTVDLTKVSQAVGQADATVGYPGNIKNYQVVSAPAGYNALLIKGATLDVWKLQVFTTANTELAQAAYPAEILAGTFILEVEGPKGQI